MQRVNPYKALKAGGVKDTCKMPTLTHDADHRQQSKGMGFSWDESPTLHLMNRFLSIVGKKHVIPAQGDPVLIGADSFLEYCGVRKQAGVHIISLTSCNSWGYSEIPTYKKLQEKGLWLLPHDVRKEVISRVRYAKKKLKPKKEAEKEASPTLTLSVLYLGEIKETPKEKKEYRGPNPYYKKYSHNMSKEIRAKKIGMFNYDRPTYGR